jgi:hypothetical protein
LSSFLAGLLYLHGRLDLIHLGHFYSYITAAPSGLKAIVYGERTTSGKTKPAAIPISNRHWRLTKALGTDARLINDLANDRLNCSIDRLKSVLEEVPLTLSSYNYMSWAERHRT